MWVMRWGPPPEASAPADLWNWAVCNDGGPVPSRGAWGIPSLLWGMATLHWPLELGVQKTGKAR